jgi:hypothetical protein
MSELQQIIPRPGIIRPERPYQTPDRRWEEVCDQIYGSSALPENIRFERDPLYRTRIFTMQAAHDHTNWFWSSIYALMIFADLCWYFLRMVA